MPRRNGYFQQAFTDWFETNRKRFAVPVSIKMLNGGRVGIKLLGQPDCLHIAANPQNLGVWVRWQGESWDVLLDLDVLPAKTPEGLRCSLCEGLPVKVWPNLESLWEDHIFGEFLRWVNERYAPADCIAIFRCSAKLSSFNQTEKHEEARAEIPLHKT